MELVEEVRGLIDVARNLEENLVKLERKISDKERGKKNVK